MIHSRRCRHSSNYLRSICYRSRCNKRQSGTHSRGCLSFTSNRSQNQIRCCWKWYCHRCRYECPCYQRNRCHSRSLVIKNYAPFFSHFYTLYDGYTLPHSSPGLNIHLIRYSRLRSKGNRRNHRSIYRIQDSKCSTKRARIRGNS